MLRPRPGRLPHRAHRARGLTVSGTRSPGPAVERRAIVDLGSNTFRMVVYEHDRTATIVPGGAWRQTAELYAPVRIGADTGRDGALSPEPVRRALEAIELFDHFCGAHDLGPEHIDAVATSAIREAPNRDVVLGPALRDTRLRPRVLPREEEAHYGYLAAANSTTLADGAVLDIGGGSLQVVRTKDRAATAARSWRLGAVRTTEAFLAGDGPASRSGLRALRRHVEEELSAAPWLVGAGGRLVGVGGTVRNLAAAVQRRGGDTTDLGVQGVAVGRDELADLVAELAALSPTDRGSVAGVKPGRADVILAGAVTIQTLLEVGGFDAVEATEAGLREGVFLERHLAVAPDAVVLGDEAAGAYRAAHLFPDVRDASVRNLAARYDEDPAHARHVEHLALELFDDLAAVGLHDADPLERVLLAAAAALHDIGMAVGYDDHHKHGRYLLVANGLPGFSPAETAVVGQAIRYHRKGDPTMKPFRALAGPDDEERLARLAAILRLAEGMERGHDQAVRGIRCARDGDRLTLALRSAAGNGGGDGSRSGSPVARWAALGQAELVRRAFGVDLTVVESA